MLSEATSRRQRWLAPWTLAFWLAAATGPATAGTDGSWQQLPPPPWLIWHGAVYDPLRDRMILFAGSDGLRLQNDLWELALAGEPGWRKLHAAGVAPPALYRLGAVYDPVRDRLLVFGGSTLNGLTTIFHNEVWALSLAGDLEWSRLTTAGTPPAPRTGREIVYDSIADRLLVFGGLTASGTVADVWSLSLAGTPTWAPLAPSGTPPARRYFGSFVFDPVRNRAILFGGREEAIANAASMNDTWELSLSGSPAWSAISPGGTIPPRRHGHTAFYDPIGDRMIVLNGAYLVGSTLNGIQDAHALTLGADPTWSLLAAPGPAHPSGYGGSAVYDPKGRRALLYGNWPGNPSSVSHDVSALSLDGAPQWSKAWTAQTPRATGRESHTAILDPIRRRMLVFGGEVRWFNEPRPVVNDLWALDLDPPHGWTQLEPSGVAPAARTGHTAVYDPGRDRMIVHGGWNLSTDFGDLWELSLSGTLAWRPLASSGTPPVARREHTAIYDPVGDRMILYGGQVGGVAAEDVWQLALAGTPTWTRITATGPGVRSGHTAIYDDVGDRMIVFGGANLTTFADVWALALAGTPQWSALFPTGSPPGVRRDHSAVLDVARGRMLVYGGDVGDRLTFRGDLVALSLTGAPAWTALAPLDPPLPLGGHSAVYDVVRDGMWVYGGVGGNRVSTYWPTGGPTSLWIESFTLARTDAGIEIHWVAGEQAASEDFLLVASRGGKSWTVEIESTRGEVFVARDRSPQLDSGGSVAYTLSSRDPERGWIVLASETLVLEGSVASTRLLAPVPNPARGPIAIPFVLGRGGQVVVTVHDVAGREVARLHEGFLARGAGRFVWSGTGGRGARLAAGVYVVRMSTPAGVHTRKLTLAR